MKISKFTDKEVKMVLSAETGIRSVRFVGNRQAYALPLEEAAPECRGSEDCPIPPLLRE